MSVKLENLRTFVTVADCGALSEAAALLNRTPSAVSMGLKQFEEQLGAALFETDRKSTLTPLGRFVLEEGQRALNDFDESMRTIQRYVGGEMGTIRLATVPSVATSLLPGVVQQFQADRPNVRLELRDIDSVSVATAVRNGSVDFGIASRPTAISDLTTELLLEEPFGVICHTSHPLTTIGTPIRWSMLKDIPLISNGLSTRISHPTFSPLNSNSAIHIHNIATLLSFVRRGIGITLLPRLVIQDDAGLCFLPLADKSILRRLHFLQHKQHRLNPAAEALKSILQQTIRAV
ncbi:MAG: LysR family transcriptional regulator [Thiolinea sp.]